MDKEVFDWDRFEANLAALTPDAMSLLILASCSSDPHAALAKLREHWAKESPFRDADA